MKPRILVYAACFASIGLAAPVIKAPEQDVANGVSNNARNKVDATDISRIYLPSNLLLGRCKKTDLTDGLSHGDSNAGTDGPGKTSWRSGPLKKMKTLVSATTSFDLPPSGSGGDDSRYLGNDICGMNKKVSQYANAISVTGKIQSRVLHLMSGRGVNPNNDNTIDKLYERGNFERLQEIWDQLSRDNPNLYPLIPSLAGRGRDLSAAGAGDGDNNGLDTRYLDTQRDESSNSKRLFADIPDKRSWVDDVLRVVTQLEPLVVPLIQHTGGFLEDAIKALEEIDIKELDASDDLSTLITKFEPLSIALVTHIDHFLEAVCKAAKKFDGLSKRKMKVSGLQKETGSDANATTK